MKVLLCGGNGQLGQALRQTLSGSDSGLELEAHGSETFNLTDSEQMARVFASAKLIRPSFDRTVFVNVPDLRLFSEGNNAWQRDQDALSDWLAFLDGRAERAVGRADHGRAPAHREVEGVAGREAAAAVGVEEDQGDDRRPGVPPAAMTVAVADLPWLPMGFVTHRAAHAAAGDWR